MAQAQGGLTGKRRRDYASFRDVSCGLLRQGYGEVARLLSGGTGLPGAPGPEAGYYHRWPPPRLQTSACYEAASDLGLRRGRRTAPTRDDRAPGRTARWRTH